MRWRWDFLGCTIGQGQFKDWSWRALINEKPDVALGLLYDESLVLHPEVSAAVNAALEEAHERGATFTRPEVRSSHRSGDIHTDQDSGRSSLLARGSEGRQEDVGVVPPQSLSSGNETTVGGRSRHQDHASERRQDSISTGDQEGTGNPESVPPDASLGRD